MGEPIPERIANAPELQIGLQLYLNAFYDLDKERNHGMGLTYIPWSSIVNYARAFEFDEEQTEDLCFLIRAMDAAHIERLSKESK